MIGRYWAWALAASLALIALLLLGKWAEAEAQTPALYHLCIAASAPNTVYCLFAVPGL